MKPKIGSRWLYRTHNQVSYKVLRYVDENNVVCEFDVGFGKQESFPFPWADLLKYHRPGPTLVEVTQ